MKIEYFGHSCFRLTTENGLQILTDPFTGVGYEMPKDVTADFVTVSHAHFDHNFVQGVTGVKKVISQTGKTVFDRVVVDGVASWHDEKQGALRGKNVIYKIVADGICVCHLGDLGESCCNDLLEKIGKVDVLLLPIGGRYTIDAFQAKLYADAIDCKIVIPMHYRPLDGTIDVADEKAFLRTCENVVYANPKHCVTVKKEDLLNEKKILFMEREKRRG